MREKDELRKLMKILRKSLSDRQRDEFNNQIVGKVVELEEYQNSKLIFTYITTQSEVDTVSLILQAFSDHKRVAVPRVCGDNMEFYEIDSLDDCVEGTYHILEPKTQRIVIPENESNMIMLIPGLAFDLNMNRCGYGKGYYDKYLNMHKSADFLKVGLAYECQLVSEVPNFEFDIKMDYLISESRVITNLVKK
mgnify:CR=1 FL=1